MINCAVSHIGGFADKYNFVMISFDRAQCNYYEDQFLKLVYRYLHKNINTIDIVGNVDLQTVVPHFSYNLWLKTSQSPMHYSCTIYVADMNITIIHK